MKTITFLRHSKSSWDYNVSDIDRPLSEFGIEKIKKIADLSKDQFISTERLFTSPANRAIHTCLILSSRLSIDTGKIKICEDLYTFSYTDVFKFIKQVDNNLTNITLVGHNPAYTDISNFFSKNKILNLPTARWFSMKFDSNKWSDIFKLEPAIYLNNIKSEK